MSEYSGIVADLPDHVYHARPELSSTEARLLLDSPAKYRWGKDNPPFIEPSTKFDIGTAVHAKVLGRGAQTVVLDFPDYRTKEARAAREDARADGLTPILAAEYESINAMSESVLAHPAARQLFGQPADAEVSVFAEDPFTGIQVRARFDFLPTDFRLGEPSRIAVDLKTTRDASPRGFARSIADYQYDVQRTWYLDALRWTTGEIAELVFVAVEKTPPYLVGVYQLPSVWTQMGDAKAARARQVYRECSESGIWPGYASDVQLLSPPNWLTYQFEEDYPND